MPVMSTMAVRACLAMIVSSRVSVISALRWLSTMPTTGRQSTPAQTSLIGVWAGVLCLPVVGIVDSQRSAEMTETLLETIIAKQARTAIVDITGIDVMDTKTADHFIKMARAVR